MPTDSPNRTGDFGYAALAIPYEARAEACLCHVAILTKREADDMLVGRCEVIRRQPDEWELRLTIPGLGLLERAGATSGVEALRLATEWQRELRALGWR